MVFPLALIMLATVSDAPPPRAEQLEFDPSSADWVRVAAPEPGTAEGDLALARQHLADEDYDAAVKAMKRWFDDHGDGQALERPARLSLAEGFFGQREYYKAYESCLPVMAEGVADRDSARAAELMFVIAEVYLSGTRRKWMGLRILSSEDLAIEILDSLSTLQSPPHIAADALKTKADFYFDQGDFNLAEDEYAKILTAHPLSNYVPWAALRRAQAALARFPGTRFDDAALVEAEERFIRFRAEFPADAEVQNVDLILEDIRNTRAQKEFEIAQFYEKAGQSRAADFYYRSVVSNWPGTVAATRAGLRIQAPMPVEEGPPAPDQEPPR